MEIAIVNDTVGVAIVIVCIVLCVALTMIMAIWAGGNYKKGKDYLKEVSLGVLSLIVTIVIAVTVALCYPRLEVGEKVGLTSFVQENNLVSVNENDSLVDILSHKCSYGKQAIEAVNTETLDKVYIVTERNDNKCMVKVSD